MIRLATKNDLDYIMNIVRQTISIMKTEGNPQWTETYPSRDDFETDICSESLYVYTDDSTNNVIAFICINSTSTPEYSEVEWGSEQQFLVLHRLAVDSNLRKQGIGSLMLSFAEEYSKEKGIYYLRTDTNSMNKGMNGLFTKFGYVKRGEVHFRSLTEHFNCYDKLL